LLPRHPGNGLACGPIHQRVAYGAGDFVNRRIGSCDMEQPACAFIKRQALCFDLQGELRDFQPGEGRACPA
jgi:hypothetical protein